MKKLILIPLFLSMSSCLPQDTNTGYTDQPPICYANGDPQPAVVGSSQMSYLPPTSYKMITASFAPSDFGMQTFAQQVRVKLNGAVVYNSCRPVDLDGFSMQNTSSYLYFQNGFTEKPNVAR